VIFISCKIAVIRDAEHPKVTRNFKVSGSYCVPAFEPTEISFMHKLVGRARARACVCVTCLHTRLYKLQLTSASHGGVATRRHFTTFDFTHKAVSTNITRVSKCQDLLKLVFSGLPTAAILVTLVTRRPLSAVTCTDIKAPSM
jgi:hypothetical protein